MDNLQELTLQPETLANARNLASEFHLDVNVVVEDATQLGLDILRQKLAFRERLKNPASGNRKEALAILSSAGRGNPPEPGDELPEGYRRSA